MPLTNEKIADAGAAVKTEQERSVNHGADNPACIIAVERKGKACHHAHRVHVYSTECQETLQTFLPRPVLSRLLASGSIQLGAFASTAFRVGVTQADFYPG